jgi:hypothetical protein
MIKQIIENKKAKTKKDIYRLTHPLEAVKEQVDLGKTLIYGQTDYPPQAKFVLNKYANNIIQSIELHRKPLSKVIMNFLNIWTGNEVDKRLKEQPKDELFHISCWVTLTNGKKLLIEKNDVVSIKENPVKSKEEQSSQSVPKPNNLSLLNFLENARKKVGNAKFFKYNSRSNNCGMFIQMLLKANNLNTSATDAYINQDTKTILAGFPRLKKLMNSVTDVAGKINILTQENNNIPQPKRKIQEPVQEPVEENVEPQETIIEGDGLRKRTNKWIEFVKNIQKEKGITYKEALIISKSIYKK